MASWCMTSIKPCHALETAVKAARAEMELKSKIRRTISGGRTVKGSVPGEVVLILSRQWFVSKGEVEVFGLRCHTAVSHRLR